MTKALIAAIAATTEEVAAVEDPVERYEAAREARTLYKDGDRDLMLIQQEVANTLKEGRTWAAVGSMLGITGSRAEQVARGRGTTGHAAESTPPARAEEGHADDTTAPESA
jgi:hypothetical protein